MAKPAIPLFTLAVLALGAGSAAAAPSPADKSFAAVAAQAGLFEVQAGYLAEHQAATAELRQFGKALKQDQSNAAHELWRLADTENLTLPAEAGSSEQEQVGKLGVLSGPAFDRAFVQEQVNQIRKEIAAFDQEARSGQSAGLKAFAAKNIPVLKKQLQLAESLRANLAAAKTPCASTM